MRGTAALLALAAAGCAHVSELPDGSRRVVGLVSLTIPAAIPDARRGADRLDVKGVGLVVVSNSAGTSVTLGYAQERITSVRNNALVEISEWGESR
jgi:hypothetical protein